MHDMLVDERGGILVARFDPLNDLPTRIVVDKAKFRFSTYVGDRFESGGTITSRACGLLCAAPTVPMAVLDADGRILGAFIVPVESEEGTTPKAAADVVRVADPASFVARHFRGGSRVEVDICSPVGKAPDRRPGVLLAAMVMTGAITRLDRAA